MQAELDKMFSLLRGWFVCVCVLFFMLLSFRLALNGRWRAITVNACDMQSSFDEKCQQRRLYIVETINVNLYERNAQSAKKMCHDDKLYVWPDLVAVSLSSKTFRTSSSSVSFFLSFLFSQWNKHFQLYQSYSPHSFRFQSFCCCCCCFQVYKETDHQRFMCHLIKSFSNWMYVLIRAYVCVPEAFLLLLLLLFILFFFIWTEVFDLKRRSHQLFSGVVFRMVIANAAHHSEFKYIQVKKKFSDNLV